MITVYWLLLHFQCVVIAGIVFFSGMRFARSATLFAPAGWFVMFYTLAFIAPQIAISFNDFSLLVPGNTYEYGHIDRLVTGQLVCCAFLSSFAIGFIPLASGAKRRRAFRPFERNELLLVGISGLVGLCALLVILQRFDPSNPRSTIVGSSSGMVLYGLTFGLTMGMVVWPANFLKARHYGAAFLSVVLPGTLLFLLGGRGRLMWPFASVFAWKMICFPVSLNLSRVLTSALLFLVCLQTLDSVLMALRGESMAAVKEQLSEDLTLKKLFIARNFESFQSVAVIASYDKIPTRLGLLLGGTQREFMATYFPKVLDRGIGFPASLPGGLWLVGKYPAVMIGGLAFGIFFAGLTWLFVSLDTELEVAVYTIAMPWLALVSGAYLEMYPKFLAAITPGLVCVMLASTIRRQLQLKKQMMPKHGRSPRTSLSHDRDLSLPQNDPNRASTI